MQKITILIADDHLLIRETWSLILATDPQFEVVAECGTGEEAVKLARKLHPKVVLMDVDLPGINGIEATAQICSYDPGCSVLGLSLHKEPAFVLRMIEAGARGYLTKASSRKEMFAAIVDVSRGKKFICNEIKDILSDQLLLGGGIQPGIGSLSRRELEIVQLIKKGSTSKEIAAELELSVRTVEVYRCNILKKLELKNTAALVNYISQHPF